jgi:hypothetical protein
VEQGGIGFSTDRTIGTEHVGNCVGIIVRDPVTGRTALAHYDDTSTPDSLSLIFDGMPKGRTLDVVLIGAKYGPESQEGDYVRQSSAKNLRDVLSFMASKDIRIVAARVNDPQQPHAFAVDPENFRIVPTEDFVSNPLQGYAFARKFLGGGQPQPMAVEFDFAKSPGRNLYQLGAEQRANLESRVRGRELDDIAQWHREKGARGGFEFAMAELSRTYLDAFDRGGIFTAQNSTIEAGAVPHIIRTTPTPAI